LKKEMEAYDITLLCVCVHLTPEDWKSRGRREPFLGNGSVNTFPRERIHTQQWNIGHGVFYAVRVSNIEYEMNGK
jgi:hypothetical protein